ncbi:hypothetical protein DENSPDRAFT_932711 [Dentipellis sp. KUC8613]|nr:hypothetical protein DENSPDRAFT_932711 [Dentipellis sp. KUC8613]
MDALVGVMCSVRTRRNAVVHVERLPVEILTWIFGLFQEFDPSAQGRSAALAYRRLWSHFLLESGPKWTEESLNRSRKCPIHLGSVSYAHDVPPYDSKQGILGWDPGALADARALEVLWGLHNVNRYDVELIFPWLSTKAVTMVPSIRALPFSEFALSA